MSVQTPKRSGGKDEKRNILIVVGVAAVAGLGYYLYTQYGSSGSTTAGGGSSGGGSSGGGTLSSGQQSYQLGSSTETGTPAASTSSGDSDG
ncbi:MAG: hypothetical protein WCA31_05855 [Acidimicrobiales bacterium]